MADKISPERRSANMRQIKSKGMKPEMTVRGLTYRLGYRFRLHRRDLPGNPDLVFASRKKVIFVHGCFWHSHPDPACRDARAPSSNRAYWLPKLERNMERDKSALERLQSIGWSALVIWECETRDAAQLRNKIEGFLKR